MKFFSRRSATAMLLAVAMMSTSISPVFAEGSRELTTVPEITAEADLNANRAVRPYLEWKDRDQFGMPSKNVIHVYAKAGETIFFGSDVTEANDRSIEAIVRTESGFPSTISSDGADWAGSSIAVTLPSTTNPEKEAFNPENSTLTTEEQIESLFRDGSYLVNGEANRNAVYLFQPIENGKGHIANPTMEEKGPNGVDGTTDGYDPLSFVAPITGTYSFRFLSREYVNSDKILIPLKDTSSLASKSIDFQGSLDELKDGAISSNKLYYEPDYGDNITIYGESGRHNTAVTMTQDRTAPATAYSGAVTYKAGVDNYITIGKNQTYSGGAIGFVPLHDDVEIEIVWRSTGSDSSEYFYAMQNGHGGTQSDRISATTTGDMQVTRITNSGGYPIEAGSELRIYAQNNKNHGIEIYEIRYYYNRVDVSDVVTATEPTPTPVPTAEPTPEPTATPVPTPIVYSYSVDMSDFSEYTTKGTIELEKETAYKVYSPIGSGREGKDGFVYVNGSAEILGTTYTSWLDGYSNTTASSGSLQLTAYQDNSWFEIVLRNDGGKSSYFRQQIDSNDSTRIMSISSGESAVISTAKLSANQTVSIFPEGVNDYSVFAIIYHVQDEYPFEAVEKKIDFSSVGVHESDGFDTTISDPEFGEVTFYSSDSRGYRTEELTETEELTWGSNVANYDIGYKRLYFAKASSGIGDLNNLGAAIGIKPRHDDVSIVVRWRSINYNENLSICMGGISNSTHRRQTLNGGEIAETTLTGFPKDVLTHIYFDKWGAQVYEIIYKYPGTGDAANSTPDSGVEVAMLSGVIGAETESLSLSDLYSNGTTSVKANDVLLETNNIKVVAGGNTANISKDSGSIFASNYYVKFRANAHYNSTSTEMTTDADCVFLYVTPAVNGKLEIDQRLGSGKVLEIRDGEEYSYDYENTTTVDEYKTIEVEVTAGKTYAIYQYKTGGRFYGLRFTPEGIETSDDWTATGSTYVTEADGVYTVTQPAGTVAAAASYNLLDIMTNKPADLTTADGTITVSYDLYRPSANAPSSNWFTDISTDTSVSAWSTGNAAGFGRISGYSSWGAPYVKFVAGSAKTDNTTGAKYEFSNPQTDVWQTVTATIDLGAKTVTASLDGESSGAISDSYPTSFNNALYLNVLPSDATEANDVSLQIRNITASYAEAVVTPAPVDTTLKPVSNKYTWDFYNFKGLGINNTDYTSDMLVGEYPNAEDGKDYDYSYVYDMKVHATETNPVTINNGNLYMYWGGTFNADGTPESSVLEFIPYWSGEVTVSFNYGNVQIKQLNGAESEIVTSTGNDDTKKITLRVEGGKPVYIYPTGGSCSSYIRGVKYTPDEPSAGMERGIDEKWGITGSMVAAWDITVAQGGGQAVAGDSYTWYPHQEFPNAKLESAGTLTSADGKLSMHRGGSYGEDTRVFDGETLSSLKLNQYKDNGGSNYLSFTPETSGTIKVTGYTGDGTYGNTLIYVAQGSNLANGKVTTGYTMETISLAVNAGEEVKMYASTTGSYDSASTSAFFYKVEFIGDAQATGEGYTSIKGRAWSDIFFLNAGNYKASIYPQLHILTKEGFLYDFYMNGVQPYGFVFYSNNRGFLFDRWSLYSNPTWSGEKVVDTATGTGTKDRLQSLKHSFYSWSSGSDVGTPPVHIEKDGNNNPIIYNDNIMQSVIDGNYIPVDTAKDATHKMFFNTPQNNPAVLNAYTGLTSLREINTNQSVYENILNNIDYVGLGNVASNDEDPTTVNYGTIGIGGRFEVTVTQDDANTLAGLGANSIGVLLDFSAYDLTDTEVAPVPVLADDGTWDKWENTTGVQTDNEKNNKVSLSTIITGAGDYTLAWDGRDAYGNVVPEGIYRDNIKSFVEMGMAHFPILDAEHNPNGFKVEMVNEGNTKKTYLYYNNEAVAPKKDANDPSAWYFTSSGNRADDALPMLIADGKNMIAGWDTATQGGAMTYGEYDAGIEGSEAARDKVYAGLNSGKGASGGDGGYGNYTAIDMWSKYERQTNAKLAIGVKPIVNLKPYVSYVAINGKNDSAEKPFTVSHVGYGGQLLESYETHRGDAINDTETAQKFGNTISTGFVSRLSSASGFTNGEVAWNITIPVKDTLKSTTTNEDGSTVTTETEMSTFIKIPETAQLTSQEDIDEAEYLAYEMYSGLFSDYAIGSDEEINIGEEEMPDWEVDASFNEDSEPGIMDTPDGAEDAEMALSEESYIEEMSLLDDEVGDYDNNGKWDKATFNVASDPTLADVENSINRGNIHKVEKIGGSETGKANIKLRYKLPTQISGAGTVVVGLVVDNLYAPGSVATATFGSDGLESYHDITSLLTGESNAVRATSFADYASNKNNEYYTGKTISAGEASKINYVMDFRGDGTSVTVDGTVFTAGEYINTSLFNDNVTLTNARYDNTHGIAGANTITVKVPGSVDITVGTCAYDDMKIVVTDASGNTVATADDVVGNQQGMADGTSKGTYGCYGNDNGSVTVSYTGEATTLTIKFENSTNGANNGARFWLPYLSVVSK